MASCILSLEMHYTTGVSARGQGVEGCSLEGGRTGSRADRFFVVLLSSLDLNGFLGRQCMQNVPLYLRPCAFFPRDSMMTSAGIRHGAKSGIRSKE
ncbi:hypothetical protein Aduo_000009 [Ancylostoma duodenale]